MSSWIEAVGHASRRIQKVLGEQDEALPRAGCARQVSQELEPRRISMELLRQDSNHALKAGIVNDDNFVSVL